jgi:hypothetical protein
LQPLDYSVEQRDHILILGAGPTLLTNIKTAHDYCVNNNALVIGTSYNFEIASDYTMIVGKSVFRSRISRLRNKNLIVTDWVIKNNKDIIKKISPKYNLWHMRTSCQDASQQYWEGDISITKGVFAHHLSNCGFTALLAAHFFRPKEIMIVGFDGPDDNGFTMQHFNGETRNQKGLHKDKNISVKKGQFLGKIIAFLNSLRIGVIAFENDSLWGMNTPNLNLKII